ncbi:two-component sensor histidine kinase, partial [Streptomyces sp. SID7760]|nr:two-component sensor histidine kinase [Streptomyces sp. SID7760]
MRRRLPAWTATLTWKSGLFIVVMCCSLAAVLGALVHVQVTRQTVAAARDKALERLQDVSRDYEAGEALRPGAGIDPAGLPPELRAMALTGRRATMV